jgi:Fe-S cluster assembly iron-binding protein IscA
MHLESNAAAWILAQRPSSDLVAWFTLKKRGCAGYEHVVEWRLPATHLPRHDWFQLDPEWDHLLKDVKVSLKQTVFQTHLQWDNPHMSEACGCGQSMFLSVSS